MDMMIYELIAVVSLAARVLPLFFLGIIIRRGYLFYSVVAGVFYIILLRVSQFIPVCMGAESGCIDFSSRIIVSVFLELSVFIFYLPVLMKIGRLLGSVKPNV